MHSALPGTGGRPVGTLVAASPRRLLDGQRLLIAIITGVTWLALVGGILSSDILSNGSGGGAHHHSLPSYAAYNTQEVAPTRFGSLSVTRAELTPLADSLEVHVSMRVDNTQDAQIDAPRLEDFRLINARGAEANPTPGAWSGPAVLMADSSATVDLTSWLCATWACCGCSTAPGAPPGVIHWLRDSSLSLLLVALGLVLGAALARRLLGRCGRGASEVVIGALVAVVLASRRCPVDRAGETVRARAHVDRTGLTPDLVVGALPEATRQD